MLCLPQLNCDKHLALRGVLYSLQHIMIDLGTGNNNKVRAVLCVLLPLSDSLAELQVCCR